MQSWGFFWDFKKLRQQTRLVTQIIGCYKKWQRAGKSFAAIVLGGLYAYSLLSYQTSMFFSASSIGIRLILAKSITDTNAYPTSK